MATADVLARIDRQMARGNELMDRVIDAIGENRLFMSELTARHERATREMIAEIRALRQEGSAQTTVLADLHEQSQAHTAAILKLIDRIESGPQG
jgi:uncharacterized coiled-coil DUF342 family protein